MYLMKSKRKDDREVKEEAPEWYSCKGVFRHDNLSPKKGKKVYEERVVLLRARNFDEAIELGEKEAEEYAQSLDGVKYMGFISVYRLFEKRLRHKAEVYSIMRENKMSKKEFLDRYYDDGTERTQKMR